MVRSLALLGAAEAVIGGGEGDIAADGDFQIGLLIVDRPVPGRKPRLQVPAIGLGATRGQGRGEVVAEDIVIDMGHDGVHVLVVQPRHVGGDDAADFGDV
jgi:hypothetical protein